MKKIMTTVCVIAFAAVAASAQQKWGTVGDVNRFGAEYQAPKAEKTVTLKEKGFSLALLRANLKAAKAHRDSVAAAKEAAAKTVAQTGNSQKEAPVKVAKTKKVTLAQIIYNSIPKDGHCSTQPFK